MSEWRVQKLIFSQSFLFLRIVGMLLSFSALIFLISIFLPGQTLIQHLHWLVSGFCAQQADHFWLIAGQALPLCARDTGIYSGFLTAWIILYACGKEKAQQFPLWPWIVLSGSGLLFLVVDGGNALFSNLHWLHFYQPANLLRLISGYVGGMACAIFALPMLNRLRWGGYSEERVISRIGELAIFGVAGSIFCICCFSQQNWILLLLAFWSVGGLLTGLSHFNLLLVLLLFKQEEKLFTSWQLLPYQTGAVLLGAIELLIFAEGKQLLFAAFGTV